MKKILAVLLLVTGFIVGWATASVVAHRNFEKFNQAWSPEVQRMLNEGAELTKGMTSAEMKQLVKDAGDRARYELKASDIQTLWQAFLAREIQVALAKGDINEVHELLTASFTKLKEARAEGRFKGTDMEKLADSLVSKMEARTTSPTTGRTVPPEAAAPGVQ